MKLFALLLVLCAFTVFAQQCPRCTSYCFNGDGTAKVCGSDGCGGVCGNCPSGQDCCRGSCTCAPNCAGKVCGDDGCGGNSCGSCATGQTCSNFQCIGTGSKTCTGRTCGHDRIGGSCGSCLPGQRCRGGNCECYYDCNDQNCGTAVQDAGASSNCPSQSCGSCPSGFTCNNGLCSALAPCSVNIVVVDVITSKTLSGTCSIDIHGVGFTYTKTGLAWAPPSTAWDVGGGFGTYSFVTTCGGYQVDTESVTVTTSTTTVTLHVTPAAIPVEVYKAGDFSTQLGVTCTVQVTGSNFFFVSFQWTANTGVVFNGVSTNGFGTYEFQTACPGYSPSTQDLVLTASTSVIQLQVSSSSVVILIEEEEGSQPSITVNALVAISYGGSLIVDYSWLASQTNSWVPPHTGNFTFVVNATGYSISSQVKTITSSTSVITLYVYGCGDGFCSNGETHDTCPQDCAGLFLEFEQYDANTPVSGFTTLLYSKDPRTYGGPTGPVPNGIKPDSNVTVPSTTNVYYGNFFQLNQVVYVQVQIVNFITFYWTANLSESSGGLTFSLRGHLSATLNAGSLGYRIVNTWRTTDDEPAPYAPTNLILTMFYSDGTPCDINNPNITSNGALICQSVANSKQSGGPACIDFSLTSNSAVTTWNSKPPRNPAVAPSQAGRYLVDSGSYVVVYGITSDAGTGKQLGQTTLADALAPYGPVTYSDVYDIWRIADLLVTQPRQGGLTLTPKDYMGTSTITNNNMFFDCQISPKCSNFEVPYSDTGR